MRDFHQNQALTPSTHRELFGLTVDRLFDLKYGIERKNSSPYISWRRAVHESEMRNLVANWLSERASGDCVPPFGGIFPPLRAVSGFDLEVQIRVHALGRKFSASISFIHRSFDASIPPYLERHL